MKRDTLSTLFETHLTQAGNDVQKARRSFAHQIDDMVENEGVNLRHVSIKNLFETVVDRDNNIDRENSVEVAEALFAAGFPTLTSKLLHPIFMEGYETNTGDVMKLVRQTTSKKSKEVIGGLSSHDQPQLTREGSPYQSSSLSEKEVEIRNYKFGITVDLTLEAIMEDLTGQLVDRAQDIGIKGGVQLHAMIVQRTTDIACAATGEAANTSFRYNGQTGLAMFSADHTAIDGFANDNLPTGAALGTTTAALDGARVKFSSMKDEKGDLLVIRPKILLIHDSLWANARALMGSPQLVSGAATTPGTPTTNVFYNMYDIVATPFTTTTTAWYLGDPAMQTRLQWVWKPKTDSLGSNTVEAFQRDVVSQFKYSYKCGIGCTDYRYMVRGN